MHELLLVPTPQRTSAIHLIGRANFEDLRNISGANLDRGWATEVGFREMDIKTNETLFDWWPRDHIPLTQSDVEFDNAAARQPHVAWNWL
jgi:hypothetical protein